MAVNYTNMVERMSDAPKHLDTYFEKMFNKHGEPYYRAEFKNGADLEQFFIEKLMNVTGFSSKVIGNVLLVFNKNHN
jgi:hypothetical protein